MNVSVSDQASRAGAVRRPGMGQTRLRRPGADQETATSPPYLRVLWFTGAWYGGSLVLYLLWLVLAGGDREALAGRQFIDGLPWMFAAVVISAGLAAGLRRVTFGWGAIGVSFAAAVIGAGLATIIHSFA
jgi:hypothetical protein